MTMQSTEARWSVTIKTNRGDLVTSRADSIEEFLPQITDLMGVVKLINDENAAANASPVSHQQAVQTATAALGGEVIYTNAPQQPAQQAPLQQQYQPQATQQYAPPAPQGAPGQVEVLTDRYGGKYHYGIYDAPRMPNGEPYILKEWISKAGKQLKKWVDPMDGPRPYSANGRMKDDNGPWAN